MVISGMTDDERIEYDEAERLIGLAALTDDRAQQRQYLTAALSHLEAISDPEDADVPYSIGYAWYVHPDHDLIRRRRVERALHDALALNPDHALARAYLGHFYFDEREYQRALDE